MTDPRVDALIEEYSRLDRTRDAARMRGLLAEAAPLIDRQAKPKKWAAVRSLFAQLSEELDPAAAAAAYEEALTIWEPGTDRDAWVQCHSALGLLKSRLYPAWSDRGGEAIAHLELVIDDCPYLARLLAHLYQHRAAGDPAANWQARRKYLGLALAQVSPGDDPEKWAALSNEIGEALGEEPGADYTASIDARIAAHEAALAAVAALPHSEARLASWLALSECYLFRVAGDRSENLRRAEQYARDALRVAETGGNADAERQALLALGRTMALRDDGDPGRRVERLQEAARLFDRAAERILASGSPSAPALLANVDTLRVNLYLQLIQLGEEAWASQIGPATERALQSLDEELHASERRSLLQAAGAAMLEARAPSGARPYLDAALRMGEAALAQATTTAGRMERIFQLSDTAALCSYCLLREGAIEEALETLDRGKARLTANADSTTIGEQVLALVPPGGALLFPVFAAREGAVMIVARGPGRTLLRRVAWLPQFGKPRLLELQRGPSPDQELGGWLGAYAARRANPRGWRSQIHGIGEALYRELWSPLLAELRWSKALSRRSP
jgi:hypothetical protein